MENCTAELITTIEGKTKTWPEIVSELRHHLARRTTNAVTTAGRKTNQVESADVDGTLPSNITDHSISNVNNVPSVPPIVPQPVDYTANATPTAKVQHILDFLKNGTHEQVDAFIGKVASDWNVADIF